MMVKRSPSAEARPAIQPSPPAAAALARSGAPRGEGEAAPGGRDWLTVQEAADQLGFNAATIRKHRDELCAYRFGRRGPYRIPKAAVEFHRHHPEMLQAPKATIAVLWRKVEQLNLLSQERENRVKQMLEQFERKLKGQAA